MFTNSVVFPQKSLQLADISMYTNKAYWDGKNLRSTLNLIIHAGYFQNRIIIRELCKRSLISLPGKFFKAVLNL